jgi:hypothetical protein
VVLVPLGLRTPPGIGRAAPDALSNLVQPEQNTKLYRSYVMNHDARQVLRHRGKSPRQAGFFFRNSELNFQSAQLASLYVMYGLLGGTDCGLESRYRVGSLESGTLLCQAYEAYLELHAPASISFEHAWFLLFALQRVRRRAAARFAGQTQTCLRHVRTVRLAGLVDPDELSDSLRRRALRSDSPRPARIGECSKGISSRVPTWTAPLICGRIPRGSLPRLPMNAAARYLCCEVCGGVRLRDLLAKHKVTCDACSRVAALPA